MAAFLLGYFERFQEQEQAMSMSTEICAHKMLHFELRQKYRLDFSLKVFFAPYSYNGMLSI